MNDLLNAAAGEQAEPRRRVVLIPNSITALAVFMGFLALTQVLDGMYTTAAALLLLAALLDMLDGRAARIFHATSEFGAQFDSLADVLNYGLAPALLFYQLYFSVWGMPGVLVSFLPVLCAAVRLAHFNVQNDPHDKKPYFVGLPSTVAAALLASYVIFAGNLWDDYGAAGAAAVLVTGVSVLMVSKVRYESSAMLTQGALRIYKLALFGALAGLLIVLKTSALFVALFVFVCWGLLRAVVQQVTGVARMGT